MSFSAGNKLGPYEIVSSIGAGGMGEVYKARDSRLNRAVAVKVLPASFAADEERLRRFRLEAQSAGALNHPNILVVHDIGVQDGTLYLVSELLEGESLRDRLRHGKIGLNKTLDYARQIATGLAAAHARGMVHRDIKPENLFITKDGRVKILDFGLAKAVQGDVRADISETQTALTDPGKVVGTAAYMSPEQVRAQSLDHRSDIFSFGCVLYEMLTGQRPFSGKTPADTMSAVLKEEAPDPSTLGSETPPALDRIVRHCLEKSPDERFQSARDIAFDLESISQTSQASAMAGPQPAKRRGWIFALGAAAVLVALAGGILGGLEIAKPPALKYHRLTYRRGKIHAARFAPDGHTVVYAAQWEDEPFEIFSVRDDGPESRALGFSGSGLFAISSRSELALGTNLRAASTFVDEGTLAQAPFSGGSARPLINDVKFADWTPDGSELAVIRENPKGWNVEYPPGKPLYQGPSGGYLSELRFSPDGNHLAFIEHPQPSSDGYLAMVDRQGQKKILTALFSGNAQGLAWTPKGDEIWFTATNAGARNVLYAVTLNGRLRVVSSQVAQLVVQDIARDGRVLVTATLEYRSKIFTRGPADKAEREFSGLDWSLIRDISPDGKLITFDESGEGAGESPGAYLRDVTAPAAVRIGVGQNPMLSADGQSVLAEYNDGTGFMIYPVGPGETRKVPLKGFLIRRSFWHPNGKEVVMEASEPGHGTRIYRVGLSGGTPRAISPEGVTTNRTGCSPDGQYIPGLPPGGGKLTLYRLDGGEPHEIIGILPGEWAAGWSTDGKALFVYRRGQVPARVYRLDITSGRREFIREIAPADRAGVNAAFTIRITPDGKTYGYSSSQMLHELHIIEGLR